MIRNQTVKNFSQKNFGVLNTEVEDEKIDNKNYEKLVNKTENCEKSGNLLKKMMDKNAKTCKNLSNGYSSYIDPKHDLRFIDCRGKYSRTLNFFNYKPKIDMNRFSTKKFKIV